MHGQSVFTQYIVGKYERKHRETKMHDISQESLSSLYITLQEIQDTAVFLNQNQVELAQKLINTHRIIQAFLEEAWLLLLQVLEM